jgi:hypothetical protein
LAVFELRAQRRAGFWLAAALAASACTELAPGSDRLGSVVAGNLPEAGAPDPSWACLDAPPPGAADRVVPSVELALNVVDTVSGVAPEGLTARACAKIDVTCATPLAGPVTVADDGVLHLPVQRLFDGFVELTSPTSVPTMYFLNRELTRDSTETLTIISAAALGALAGQGGVALEPTLGHLLIRAFDCLGAPASGVQLFSSVGGLPFAFVDGLPSVGQDVTTASGLGGFVNVPVGLAVLEGRRVEGARNLGQANVVVRSGWFTYGDVEPLPQ